MAVKLGGAGTVPYLVAYIVSLATFMEVLDTSIANVSLIISPAACQVSTDESTWVLTSYLVANAIVIPNRAGSTAIGRKRYYMICVALFTATSFLCGSA